MPPAPIPARRRLIDRLSLLFHLGMGLWCVVSLSGAMRRYMAAESGGGTGGGGVEPGVLLVIWLFGGAVFAALKLMVGRR